MLDRSFSSISVFVKTIIFSVGGDFFIEIRIGLVARICRSQSSKDDQFRQGRGSIPRFGIIILLLQHRHESCIVFFWVHGRLAESRMLSFAQTNISSYSTPSSTQGVSLPEHEGLAKLRELWLQSAIQERTAHRHPDDSFLIVINVFRSHRSRSTLAPG